MYRMAFENFSNKARQVQELNDLARVEPCLIETALVELEKAHIGYIAARNAWVEYLLPFSKAKVVSMPGIEPHHEHEDCVRAIAELLWESAGRPEGTAADDWRKAEEIVKRAAAAA